MMSPTKCYHILLLLLFLGRGGSDILNRVKVDEIWELGNMIFTVFTVFIFTTATSEFSHKIQLPTALFQNFYYLVPSDATDFFYS